MCSDRENVYMAKQEYVKWSGLGMSLEKIIKTHTVTAIGQRFVSKA